MTEPDPKRTNTMVGVWTAIGIGVGRRHRRGDRQPGRRAWPWGWSSGVAVGIGLDRREGAR